MVVNHPYRVGDRVRLTCPFIGVPVGEEGEIRQVTRDGQGGVLALDVLLGAPHVRAKGVTVYPLEVELVAGNR